jgi:hypothetical protein
VNYADEIRGLWLSIGELSISLGEVRDAFLRIPGEEGRFMEIEDARKNLFQIETALFEYLEQKAPVFAKKPDRLFHAVANAAIDNTKILLAIAKGDADLKSVSPDGKLTFEQNLILLQNRVNDPKISPERKAQSERLLKMGLGVKRNKLLKSLEPKTNNAPNN